MVEIVFLMLVLKLPILYLVGVVYWAVKAEPPPPEPAVLPARIEDEPPSAPQRFHPPGPRRAGPDRRNRARRAARLPVR
jgi:hypothetical protein